MNLLHLATGKNGGARLAAEQLVRYQRLQGDEAIIIPAFSGQPDEFRIPIRKRIFSKVLTLAQKTLTKTEYGLVSSLSVSSISRVFLKAEEFDLVHIHNWFNLINIEDLRVLSRKVPLVFTLHDQRLGTGGCHYTFDCKNYVQECKQCPAVKFGHNFVHKNKVKIDKIFADIRPYGVIAPSNWILSELENQPIIKNAKSVKVIPNITEFKSQKEYNFSNQTYRKRFEILFVASEINQPVKGLFLLLNSLNNLSNKYPNLHLNIVGRGILEGKLNFSYTQHGFLDKPKVIELMNKSSLCVVPSLMDNLPSVIVEAMRNKCIVIATEVGGIGDLVIDGHTGFLIKPDDVALQKKLMQVFDLPTVAQETIRQNALIRINNKYDNNEIYQNHMNLYTEIIDNGI